MSISPANPGVWVEECKLQSFQVDFRKLASLETLCRIFQEAAWNHAEALGVGFEQLEQQHQIWVLSRLLVNVHQYPRWGETIRIHTWPRPVEGVFAMRDFQMLNSSGEVLVSGSSAWLILDALSRKPQRAGKLLSAFNTDPNHRATERDPEKIAETATLEPGMELPVRYSDIDVNGHVNNARYVGWLLDSYPIEFHQNHSVLQFEINFLAETRAGESLTTSRGKVEPCHYIHSMAKANGLGQVCRARFSWASTQSPVARLTIVSN
jgi:medium-chain acyl-[acyl-carrier-protein] hydrolase